MDKEQQERFKRAVEDKQEKAEAKGIAGTARATGGGPESDEERTGSERRHEPTDRTESTRHGQVTADKWNQ